MHITQLMVIGAGAVGCALALIACGSKAPPSGAADLRHIPGYDPAAATNPNSIGPLALSECMHSHGIKNFPDPANGGLSLETSPGSGTVIADGITFSGPAFEAAAKACAKLLPGGGGPPPPPTAQQKQQALEFAECMRKHGVPNYPDPNFSTGGGGKAPSGSPAAVNPSSPAFKQAVAACGGGRGRNVSVG